MRPIASFTLHAVLAAALAALAASSAAAADQMKKLIMFSSFKNGGNAADQHEEEIEVVSWTLGNQRPGRIAKVDGFTVKQGVRPADPGSHGEWIADVERPAEQSSYSPGNTKYANIKLTRPAGEASGDGSAVGSNETLTVGGGRTESGQATGKRQHMPVRARSYYDQGTARIKVKFPWLACKVGAAFPEAALSDGSVGYELKDIVVTACSPDSIAVSYAAIREGTVSNSKVKVRGWNPETKQE